MKQLLKIITLTIVLFNSACSPEEFIKPIISGKWTIQEEVQRSYINGVESNYDAAKNLQINDFILFYENGTAQRAEDGQFLETSLYSLDKANKTLTIRQENHKEVYQIKKLTESELVLYSEYTMIYKGKAFKNTYELVLEK